MAAPALEQLLTELLEPDSAGIRQATARLREVLEEPEAPEGLAVLLRDSQKPQVRHLAAVLLRKLLRKLPQELIDRLPHLVAEALDRETDCPTRGSLAQLGARLLLLGGPQLWEPLEKWILEAARDPQKMEGALRCLSVSLSVAGPALSGRGPALSGLCRAGLRLRSHPGIVGAALGATGALGAALGARKTALLRSLVPDVLEALQELLGLDEDRAADAFEVLDEFLEANPEALIPHLKPMLELCLQVAGDECRGDAVRARALATVTFLAQQRGRALLRGSLLPLTLRGLLVPLCAPIRPHNPDPEEEEEEGEEGPAGPCPRHAAAQVLDALAQSLPPEKLLKELLPLLEEPARGCSAGGRKGALLALAALARGCGPALRQRYLGVVLGALRAGLGDPDGAVRGAAAAAMRELKEELQPELSPLVAEALPKLLGEFWDPQNADAKSWFLLETLLEVLGEEVQPWLPQVLPRILGALEASGSERGRELALSALHALACSSESLPLPPSALGAVTALARAGPHQLQALEVVAALGPAHLGSGLLEALELGLGLLGDGDGDATKVTLQLLAAVSELLGEGAGPLLPRALPVLQGALTPPTAPPSDAPDWLLHLHDDPEGAEPMDDDVTEWAEPAEPEVGGAFVGLAEAALGALGELAENCSSAFLPHLEPFLAAILNLTQFPQSELRGAAYEALGSLCCCGRPQTAPGPSHHGAFRALLDGIRKDPEVGGALGAVGGAGRILQHPGHAPKEWLEPIGRALCDVIAGQIACLKSRGDDDEEETSQRAELRETASDWLNEVGVAMARTDDPKMADDETGSDVTSSGRGGTFPPHLFRRILPSLLAALADPAHPGARSWAAAVIGQLGGALGEEATPFLPDLGPAFRLAVGDPDPEVRANTFYAIGRIGEALGHAHHEGAWPGAELCCHALRAGEGPGKVRDNVLGALVRQPGVPVEQVLPLVLRALPLAEDLQEEEPVLKFLLGAGPERLLPHLPDFVRGVGAALSSERLNPALSQSLLSLLRQLGGANPQHFRVGVASLDPAHAAILDRMLSDVTGSQ